jgi:hypothetical protein
MPTKQDFHKLQFLHEELLRSRRLLFSGISMREVHFLQDRIKFINDEIEKISH